jgi:mannonate dehydratase
MAALAASALVPGAAQAAARVKRAGTPSATELGGPLRQKPKGEARIQFAHVAGPGAPQRLKQLKQIGVNYAIAGVSGVLGRVRREEYVSALQRLQAQFLEEGITIAGVESHPVAAEKIKLGIEGRDEEIENYKAAIDALGHVGIPVLCYNWMAGLGWYRTRSDQHERGGALTTEFDAEAAAAQGMTKWGEVSEEKMWANLDYFLKRVIPVAEKAGVKMALHPDDPPVARLRGIARIMTSAANYRRMMEIVPSPVNGVTFCQANFKAMGEDMEALVKEWCAQKKIFFVHFRDIRGNRQHFTETFHDNGPTDMARMLRVYHESGFTGPMRPDHAPTIEGDSNNNPGYAFMGQMLAFGYMKGIMDGLGYPYA